jgi:hypothetical protein
MARVARRIPELREAWSSGRISWAQAQTILPAVSEDPASAVGWIEHATSVSLRRLEEDVDVGVAQETPESLEAAERQTGAQDTCAIWWVAPADAARLFRATLCSVRRRIERATGRMPTEGEGFEAMLDHAYLAWGGREERVCAAWQVYARDGWRCTVPGCSSYRNLHDHHIRFRSAGGSDDLANRTTLCAWHHLRGVHAGIVQITGAAPGGLRFALPIATYGPGEALVVS